MGLNGPVRRHVLLVLRLVRLAAVELLQVKQQGVALVELVAFLVLLDQRLQRRRRGTIAAVQRVREEMLWLLQH